MSKKYRSQMQYLARSSILHRHHRTLSYADSNQALVAKSRNQLLTLNPPLTCFTFHYLTTPLPTTTQDAKMWKPSCPWRQGQQDFLSHYRWSVDGVLLMNIAECLGEAWRPPALHCMVVVSLSANHCTY
ncbi:hypothetical protein TcWFU_006936 [Taenia crassiceps]|uniref:Uncharacterized protein n=1 Tax=Taenia crassiceps TaxID=6207 RepID=A0ABR4PYV5_9CEST